MKFSCLSRVYTNKPIIKNQMIIIENDTFYYLKSVIRVRKSETFRLFNSFDGEFLVRVKEINRSSLVIEVESLIREVESCKELILALCIIKQDRMIEAIKSAVQLGVTKIIPIISERTQYKKISSKKIQKCIIQSVEQSERFIPPTLEKETCLSDFCESENEQVIFSCESEDENSKISNISKIKDNPFILIGAEGGFSDAEILIIKSMKQTEAVSLGRTVLRTEVAVANALSCISMMRD
jgi:16S rRNA (uracil1498-N3)-methyltransferase